MQMINTKTRKPVTIGQTVKCFRGEKWTIVSFEMPRHSGSTGRIYARSVEKGWSQGFFPSVFECEWTES